MIRFSSLWFVLPLVISASPALADPAEAVSCAKHLSPAALEIYRAAAPDMGQGSDIATLLRARVLPMVMNGDMNRTTARIAATAASVCLRDLRQPTLEVARAISTARPGENSTAAEMQGAN